jgi:hypothetical protein
MKCFKYYQQLQWIFIIFYFISGVGMADILMENIGAKLNVKKDSYDVVQEKTSETYSYPCLDRRHEPKYVMMLFKELDYYRQTMHIYRLDDLIDFMNITVRPEKIYPTHGQMKGPSSFSAEEVPWAFHLGLFFLIRGNGYWQIYQFNKIHPSNDLKSFYNDSQMPWYFDTTGYGFAYALNNRVLTVGNKIAGNEKNTKHNILSFHIPDSNNQAISYYNEKHNPDIRIIQNNESFLFDEKKISSFYPKYSENKKYIAFFQNQSDQQDSWELVIYRTSALKQKKPCKIIKDVKIYDIESTAFYYHDAFHWLDNKVYYQKHLQSSTLPGIFQYDPEKLKEERLLFQDGHFRWKQMADGDLLDFQLKILISRLGWFQVAKLKNKLLVISECYIKMASETVVESKGNNIVQRILVFQQK